MATTAASESYAWTGALLAAGASISTGGVSPGGAFPGGASAAVGAVLRSDDPVCTSAGSSVVVFATDMFAYRLEPGALFFFVLAIAVITKRSSVDGDVCRDGSVDDGGGSAAAGCATCYFDTLCLEPQTPSGPSGPSGRISSWPLKNARRQTLRTWPRCGPGPGKRKGFDCDGRSPAACTLFAIYIQGLEDKCLMQRTHAFDLSRFKQGVLNVCSSAPFRAKSKRNLVE